MTSSREELGPGRGDKASEAHVGVLGSQRAGSLVEQHTHLSRILSLGPQSCGHPPFPRELRVWQWAGTGPLPIILPLWLILRVSQR